MSASFESVWRAARAEMPLVPGLVVRGWAQEGLNIACDFWGWAFLRSEGNISIRAARTVTVTVTQGSTTVTSTGAFLSTDAGRQIRLSSSTSNQGRLPLYTIVSVTSINEIVLDQPYADEDAADTTASIVDAYFTAPADFKRFLIVYDRYYLRTIPFWLSEDEIGVADPGRVFSDTGPRYLVAQRYSPATATLGQVRYEYWPAPSSARVYPYLYIKSAPQLADANALPGVFGQRPDLLKTYIQWQNALLPAVGDQRNPGFNPVVAQLRQKEWQEKLQVLSLRDDEEYPQQYATIQWARRHGAIAPTATLLRQTDATINDYY